LGLGEGRIEGNGWVSGKVGEKKGMAKRRDEAGRGW